MCDNRQPLVGGDVVMYWCDLHDHPCDYGDDELDECPDCPPEYNEDDVIEEVSLEELAELEGI